MDTPMNLTTRILAEAFASGGPVCCEYCYREVRCDIASNAPTRATADHRTPRARGGKNVRSNIAIACLRCNHRKGPLTAQEFISLQHDPRRLAEIVKAWTHRLNPETPRYKNRHEQKLAKRGRRLSRISNRIHPADPDCADCRGTGKIRKGRLDRICLCALEPLDPERAAAHIDGRQLRRSA